jgi:phosphoribosyl 1,2-cyclic phosphodiesterase
MRLWMLGSGSRGNAVLVESGGSRVLIDAGFTPRVLARRLAALDIPCESIEAVVITHEHQDHVQGACAAADQWGWALYATQGTAAAHPPLADAGARTFAAGAAIELRAMTVQSIPTPHDAAEPVALVVTDRASGTRAGIAYDLGYASAAVRAALGDLAILVLEANHDEGMLRAGPYPPSVRERIAGSHGHLSNRAAAALAADCAHRDLAHIVLAHLSESCNDPALATTTVRSALARTTFRGQVAAASQRTPVGPFTAGSGPAQLALQL